MPLMPDPTFYPSPLMAMQAPPERLAYVALLNVGQNGQRDAMGVVDLDPTSSGYGQLVGQVDFPHGDNELHHFGWNACSACLCPQAPHAHMERRYLIVPGLVYWVGYSQHMAIGTSLAILLPPIGLAAVLEHYRHGNVDLRAALFIAVPMFVGGFLGAFLANKMSGPYLRLVFGLFILFMGVTLVYGACRRLGWI